MQFHYCDVTMGMMASQITSLTIIYSTVYTDGGQRKHQSSASLAFVRGIHRVSVNSPHKWPVTGKMFPFEDVIMPSYPLISVKRQRLSTSMWNAWNIMCNLCILLMDYLESIISYQVVTENNIPEYIWQILSPCLIRPELDWDIVTLVL